uniref:Uncharacterized protein TCIL3000_11_6480 n=1 Tax=Trypanosoma congolense (strain IL3000) TaxID=1068625 RepID=G0V0Q1_TRYCI|nr:unnamed protein product [Trypanosoma congolense IL3000]
MLCCSFPLYLHTLYIPLLYTDFIFSASPAHNHTDASLPIPRNMMQLNSVLALALPLLMKLARGALADDTAACNSSGPNGPECEVKEFPLVWVCLGITIVGIAIAMYVAYRRPDELQLPGSSDDGTETTERPAEEYKRGEMTEYKTKEPALEQTEGDGTRKEETV